MELKFVQIAVGDEDNLYGLDSEGRVWHYDWANSSKTQKHWRPLSMTRKPDTKPRQV